MINMLDNDIVVNSRSSRTISSLSQAKSKNSLILFAMD